MATDPAGHLASVDHPITASGDPSAPRGTRWKWAVGAAACVALGVWAWLPDERAEFEDLCNAWERSGAATMDPGEAAFPRYEQWVIDNVRGDALYTFSIAERGRTGVLFFLAGQNAREHGFDLTESNCRDMARELAGTHVSVADAGIAVRIPEEWDLIGPLPTHTLAVNLRNDSMFELSDIRVKVRLFGVNGKAFDAQEVAVEGSLPAGTATDLIGLRMGVSTYRVFTERASNEFVAADPTLRDRLEHVVALTARLYDGQPADVSKATLSVTAQYEGRRLEFPEVEVINRPD